MTRRLPARTHHSDETLEWVIVGGGIHGICLANHVLSASEFTHDDVRIVDPNEELLASFESKARACRMESLRSTFVHHIGTDPFSLASFAEGRGRTGELLDTEDYPARPTLDLFLDHTRWVIDHNGIGNCHQQASVRGLCERQDTLVVETDNGTLETRHVVLAVGLGSGPNYPTWAESLTDDPALTHVWDDGFDPEAPSRYSETVVVGGGITAAQVACELGDSSDVTLLSRHELETATTEADPHWINWPHIEEHLHTLPPGSAMRRNRVRAARNDATIPPYVQRRLTDARERGRIDVRRGEIPCAYSDENGLLLRLDDGRTVSNARVVLATGLDPVSDHPLVASVAERLSLERGVEGYPVLDDETLAWRRQEGGDSNVFVSGALAELTVGPLARNIVGARRVAQRLTGVGTERHGDQSESGRAVPSHSS